MSISTRALANTVAELTAPGKGILVADESTGTIEKRLKAVNVTSTEEARRDYRELLFSTPGLGDFISGVILFEETLKQKSATGVPLPEVLKAQGIVPGIKVDKGTVPLPGFPGETVTQGLDGLAQRLSRSRLRAYTIFCSAGEIRCVVFVALLLLGALHGIAWQFWSKRLR